MTTDPFVARGRSFEEAYFRRKDEELVSKLRKIFQTKLSKEELRKSTGVENEEVLDRLVSLNLRGSCSARQALPRWWRSRGRMGAWTRRRSRRW